MLFLNRSLPLLLAFAFAMPVASRAQSQGSAQSNRAMQVSHDERQQMLREEPRTYTPPPMLSPPAAAVSGGEARPAGALRREDASQGNVRLASHAEPTPDSRYEQIILQPTEGPRLNTPASRSTGAGKAGATVATSLAIVISAFFLLVWLSRKAAPKGLVSLPSEVVESLGRSQLSARQQMQLIRLGRKLVLLSVTSTGVETITEVTDLEEVERLCALCQQNRSGSMSETFRQVLSQFGNEPAPSGFIGDPAASQVELANRGGLQEDEIV